ncbi:hypothetical protein [Hoeflea sp.]|uniref:hypothetical protein n=1 Tax=Hoeflea sp. TaxID=1940281 RepID=UPI003749921E
MSEWNFYGPRFLRLQGALKALLQLFDKFAASKRAADLITVTVTAIQLLQQPVANAPSHMPAATASSTFVAPHRASL